MKHENIEKINQYIVTDNAIGLSGMNLQQIDGYEEYAVSFFIAALSSKKNNAAYELFQKIEDKELTVKEYNAILSYYVRDMDGLSFLEGFIKKNINRCSKDDITENCAYLIGNLDNFEKFIKIIRFGNSGVWKDLFEIVVSRNNLWEQDVIKHLEIMKEYYPELYSSLYKTSGEINLLYSTLLRTRSFCAKIFNFLNSNGLKIPMADDGYCPLLEETVSCLTPNPGVLTFLIEQGANPFVANTPVSLSVYEMAEMNGFWDKYDSVKEAVLNKFNKDSSYKSFNLKTYEAFQKGDLNTFVTNIKNGAAIINPYVSCQLSSRNSGYLTRALELSDNFPLYFEVAKEILKKAEDLDIPSREMLENEAYMAHPAVLANCIKLGFDPNKKCNERGTYFNVSCLEYIADPELLPMIKRLVKLGSDPTACYSNYNGEDMNLLDELVMYYTEKEMKNYFEIIDYLSEKGCVLHQTAKEHLLNFPETVAKFETVLLKVFDGSELDFDNMLQNCRNRLEDKTWQYNQYVNSLNDFLKNIPEEEKKNI